MDTIVILVFIGSTVAMACVSIKFQLISLQKLQVTVRGTMKKLKSQTCFYGTKITAK